MGKWRFLLKHYNEAVFSTKGSKLLEQNYIHKEGCTAWGFVLILAHGRI